MIYSTCFFAYAYGLTFDMIFDLHYDFYGYFQKGFQWKGFFGTILYFPSISLLFLNFFPFEQKISIKLLYTLCWSIFSTFFEWVSIQTGFFYHNEWKLWYSALLYPIIFFTLVINMRFVQKINR
ncbi:CBO0543 family protein [Pseudobacillus sp. 179-B 2D1 NHS]|uniref:CBO0543 family protein n=1 Tax=unclassified Pseudobacillus TaxID=2619284 RepID=UPI00387939AF